QAPIWIPILRGVQFLFSIIIFALSANLIHGKYFSAMGFAIFCSLLTWIVISYNLGTKYISSLNSFWNQFAVIGADAVMILFWLSSMGASAALRIAFRYPVTVDGCYSDGSTINSETCVVERGLEKRGAVASNAGLSMMSAVAGLSALEMFLFIVCLVYYVLTWFRLRSKFSSSAGYTPPRQPESYQMGGQTQPYAPRPQYEPQYAPQAHTQPYAQ
ncbi:hypothetical protein N431DRAFT_306763, partial [Stipitochalara longipes BDJ]